jgi:hypothetical protein
MNRLRIIFAAALVAAALAVFSCSGNPHHNPYVNTQTTASTDTGTGTGTWTPCPFTGYISWEHAEGPVGDIWRLNGIYISDNWTCTTVNNILYPVASDNSMTHPMTCEEYNNLDNLIYASDFFNLNAEYTFGNSISGTYDTIFYDNGSQSHTVTIYEGATLLPKGLEDLDNGLELLYGLKRK